MSDDDLNSRIVGLEKGQEYMQKSIAPLSVKLDLILAQGAKVAVLEERSAIQQTNSIATSRQITEIEEKHDALSEEVKEFISYVKGMTRMAMFLWTGIGAAVVMLLIKTLFFNTTGGHVG